MARLHRARTKGGKAPVFADGSTLAEAASRAARAPAPAVAARAAADEIVRLTADVEQASSRLAHFRAALRRAGAPPGAVDAAKRPAITTAANQIRFDRFGAAGGRAQTGLAPPAAWGFDAVSARLARADPAGPATKGAVLDVMVALAARPAELARLAIGPDDLVRGFAKARGAAARPYAGMLERGRAAALLGWVQAAIRAGQVPDPGTPGSKPYRALLAPHGLKPKDLRALGAEYAARAAGAQTDAMRSEVRRLALRHKAARAPTQYYSIVRDGEVVCGAPRSARRPGAPPGAAARGEPRPARRLKGRPGAAAPRSVTEPRRKRAGRPERVRLAPAEPKKRSQSARASRRAYGSAYLGSRTQ